MSEVTATRMRVMFADNRTKPRHRITRIAIAALLGAASVTATAAPAAAQPAEKLHRIGFLTEGSVDNFKPRLAAFRQGLQELGYIEGKNIVIEERYAEGRNEKIPELAAQLVALKVEIVVTHGGTKAQIVDRAAKAAGLTIPVVFAADPDPVATGVVTSLARPDGNITGLSDSYGAPVPKRLELIKEVVPSATRVAVLFSGWPSIAVQWKPLQSAARALGVTLRGIKFEEPDDLDVAFAVLRRERPDALDVLGYPLTDRYRREITAFALANKLPTIFTSERNVRIGGLMSYGVNFFDMYRRTATFVDKILKGAKPSDLPVEQPTRFYLTVNLKTAKALGITLPQSIFLRADRVIE